MHSEVDGKVEGVMSRKSDPRVFTAVFLKALVFKSKTKEEWI